MSDKHHDKNVLSVQELVALRDSGGLSNQQLEDMFHEYIQLKRKVTQQEEQIASLMKEATSDPLTNLVNRRVFEKELSRSLSVVKRYDRLSALLMIDVDDFKAINDTLGHATGDAVLTHVANLLRVNTRPNDIVARLGGDEFCVIMNEVNSARDVERRAEMLAERVVATPCFYNGQHVGVAISVGAYTFDQDVESVEHILKKADADMYAQKKAHHQSQRQG